MKPKKLKSKDKKFRKNRIDPDHFTVFNLRPDWEKKISKYWSKEEIHTFKIRQELLKTVPEHIGIRTKRDESYREGWIDAAAWIHQEMRKVFHQEDNPNP